MISENLFGYLRHIPVIQGTYCSVIKRSKLLAFEPHTLKISSAKMSAWSIPICIERDTIQRSNDTLSYFSKIVERMSQVTEAESQHQSFISRISNNPLSRHDPTTDTEFYSFPRFCTRIDDRAIDKLSLFYENNLNDNSTIVDLCSSWISHLPPDKNFQKVIGIGMNESELKANKRLDEHHVCDLNLKTNDSNKSLLPMLENNSINHVLCAVSIDYLIHPIAIFHEVLRILKPKSESTFIISFSNRCFPTKAIKSWLETDDAGRIGIVCSYFQESNDSKYGSWKNIKVYDLSEHNGESNPSSPNYSDPLFVIKGEKI